MSYSTQLTGTHSQIINVITSDISTVDDYSLAGVSFAKLEDHDPLGIAFYVYAMLRTGYTHIALNSLPETAKYWVEDKVSNGNLLPYIDRELTAISLTTFTLCRYKKSCPNVSGFIELASEYFDENKGVFNNFFTTALVGLGIRALEPGAEINQKLNSYLEKQIRDHSNVIFNDSKNFLAAHLWARENGYEEVLSKLVNESLDRCRREDSPPRDLVYYTYVLMEEVERISRDDRTEVRDLTERSLSFLRDYSHEVGFSSEIVKEFADDVSLDPSFKHSQSFTVRPRLSRIILSMGLLIDRLYEKNAPLFFTQEAKFNLHAKGAAYSACFFFSALCIGLLARRAGLPFNLHDAVQPHIFLPTTILLGTMFLINLFLALVITALLICALQIFYWLIIQGKPLTESEVREELKQSFHKYWKWEVVPSIITAVWGSFSG